MKPDPISVKVAMQRGIKMIKVPAKRIRLGAFILCLLSWVLIRFTWWPLLFVPLGIFAVAISTAFTLPVWRIWAYRNVNDIHQLQRAAELSGLLPLRSSDRFIGSMSWQQRQELSALFTRFSADPGFVDDLSVPAKTPIYKRAIMPAPEPLITIGESGIYLHGEGGFTWEEIENERIANVGFLSWNRLYRAYERQGVTAKYFRFDTGTVVHEFEMADLKISAWELDLLCYIYRGRSTRSVVPAVQHVP